MMLATDCPLPTDADLRDTERLSEWLTERFAFAGLPPSRYIMSRGIACGLRAVTNGNNPSKLFASLVERGQRDGWEFLTREQIASAEEAYDSMMVGGQ